MSFWFALVVLLAPVGAPFGEGAAVAEETSPSTVDLDLTVEGPAGASLVAHLVEPGGAQQTVSLREREAGLFGAVVEVAKVDYVVVFEVVREGSPVQSDPVRLTALGLDPGVLGGGQSVPTTSAEGLTNETRQWGWLGLALGLGALSLLAVWVLGARDDGATSGETGTGSGVE